MLTGADRWQHVWAAVVAQLDHAGYRVEVVTRVTGRRRGTAAPTSPTGHVHVADDLEPPQRLKTLLHEWGHVALGHADTPSRPREVMEVEAESVAYLVCATIGLDSGFVLAALPGVVGQTATPPSSSAPPSGCSPPPTPSSTRWKRNSMSSSSPTRSHTRRRPSRPPQPTDHVRHRDAPPADCDATMCCVAVVGCACRLRGRLLVQTLGRLDADLDVATAAVRRRRARRHDDDQAPHRNGADPVELRTAMARPFVDRFGDPAPLFPDRRRRPPMMCCREPTCSLPAPNRHPQPSTTEQYDPVSAPGRQLRTAVDHGDGDRSSSAEVSADEDPARLAALADALALDHPQAVAAWAGRRGRPPLAAGAALRRRNGNIELAAADLAAGWVEPIDWAGLLQPEPPVTPAQTILDTWATLATCRRPVPADAAVTADPDGSSTPSTGSPPPPPPPHRVDQRARRSDRGLGQRTRRRTPPIRAVHHHRRGRDRLGAGVAHLVAAVRTLAMHARSDLTAAAALTEAIHDWVERSARVAGVDARAD